MHKRKGKNGRKGKSVSKSYGSPQQEDLEAEVIRERSRGHCGPVAGSSLPAAVKAGTNGRATTQGHPRDRDELGQDQGVDYFHIFLASD